MIQLLLKSIKSVFMLSILVLFSFQLMATDIAPAVTSGNFNTPATWNPVQVPGIGDNIVIYSNALEVDIAITLTQNQTIANLLVEQAWPGNTETLTFKVADPSTQSYKLTITDFTASEWSNTPLTLIIEDGVTLEVNGTTQIQAENIHVKNGGKVIFNNNVGLGGQNAGITIDAGGEVTVNGLIDGTNDNVNFLNVYGTLTVDYLEEHSDPQNGNLVFNIYNGGAINVIQDVYLDYSYFSIENGGELNVEGDFTISSASGTITVDGTINIADTMDVNGGVTIDGDGTISANPFAGWGSIMGASPAKDITSGSIQDAYYSRETGDWKDKPTWSNFPGGDPVSTVPSGGDNIIIQTGHVVTNDDSDVSLNKLEIEAGGTLNNGSKALTIVEKLTVDGVLYIAANKTFNISPTTSTTIGGGGIISLKQQVQIGTMNILGDVTISAGSNLFLYGHFLISDNKTVSNYGAFEGTEEINGLGGGSTWINYENSTIKALGDIMTLGTLNATYAGNTVEYLKDGGVLLNPDNDTYHHLIISGTGDKTQQSNLTVNGDFTINSGNFLSNLFNISIKGNWTLSADTYDEGSQTVTFNGTEDQTITNPLNDTFYNLVVNKASGTLIMNNFVTVLNSLDMQSGNINTSDKILTLGTLADATVTPVITASEGSLSYANNATIIGSFKRYILDEHTATPFTFPVGIEGSYRPMEISFNTINTIVNGEYGTLTVAFKEISPGAVNSPHLDDNGTAVYNTFSEGHWTLETSNLEATALYDLSLTGENFTSFPLDDTGAKTRLLTRPNSSSPWAGVGNHVALTGSTAERIDVTTLPAEFCFGSTKNCTAPSTGAISGDNSVCINDIGDIYSVALTSGSSYVWEVIPASAASSVSAPDNSDGINSKVTINWGTTGQNAVVRVTETNTCTIGEPVDYNVQSLPISPSVIGGATAVPIGQLDSPYDVIDNIYTYTWSVSGGALAAIPVNGGANIKIDWNNTAGTGTVSVVTNDVTCGDSPSLALDVEKYIVIKSTGNNDSWDKPAAWDCNCEPSLTDNVVIQGGHTVNTKNGSEVKNLTVNGTLNCPADFPVYGNITVNGTLDITGQTLNLMASNTEIGGIGTIIGDVNNQGGSKTIVSTAILTIDGDFSNPTASTSINNQGNLTVTNSTNALKGNVTGVDGSISWNNSAHSSLKVAGTLLTNGILEASSDENTVIYNGGDQNIKTPNDGKYYNLETWGASANTKTVGTALIVLGDVSILEAASLNVASYALNVGGNWTNSSSGTLITNNDQIITFNGTVDQTITGIETFKNVIVNKSSGNLILANNMAINTALTMTSGDINLGTNMLTLGTSTPAEGALSYTAGKIIATGGGSLKRYFSNADVGLKLFPIASSTDYLPASLNITTIGTGGSITTNFTESDPGSSGIITDGGDPVISVTNQFTEGYWQFLAADGISISNYDLAFTGSNFSSYDIKSATRILMQNDGSSWENPIHGIHTTATDSTCHRTGISTYNISSGNTYNYALGHTDCNSSIANPIIEGNFNVCKGTGETYIISAATDNFNSYNWDVDVTYGTENDINDNDGSMDVTWGTTPTISATIKVIAEAGCYIAPEVTKYVNIHSLATEDLTGPANIPNNKEIGTYSVTPRADYLYNWTINPASAGDVTAITTLTASSVKVDWSAASVPATVKVEVVGYYSGCSSTPAAMIDMDATIFNATQSYQSGPWNALSTWSSDNSIPIPLPADNAYISPGHTITLDQNQGITNLVIANTATLENNVGTPFDLTMTEGYYNDGTHNVQGANVILNASATNNIIDGTGTLNLGVGEFQINNFNQQILSTADLKVNGNIVIGAGLSLYNYGITTVTGDIIGNDASSKWDNRSNATLLISGDLVSTGQLYATASDNTVNYNGAAQSIKNSSSQQYQNLVLSGGTKTFNFTLDINKDLTIESSAILDPQSNTLKLYGNWTNNDTGDSFLEGTGTVTFDGGADQTIYKNGGTETFYNLNIAKTIGGSVLLDATNISITNNVYFDKGIINTTSSKLLSFSSTASTNAGDADSFVDGPVSKVGTTAFTFPTGANSTWARIGISAPSSSSTFTGQYFEGANVNTNIEDVGIARQSGVEYWDLSRNEGTAAPNVTIYWEDGDRSGIDDLSTLLLLHWDGAKWANMGSSTSGTVGSGSITNTVAFTSYSPITNGSSTLGTNPLPVELIDFEANANNDDILLSWRTASEKNNDYFEIQRAIDGQNFKTIGIVNGNGNSHIELNYSFTDNEPIIGTSYYRLKQVDYDGQNELHHVIAVKWTNTSTNHGAIVVFPNPYSNGVLSISTADFEANTALKITIISASGQLISQDYYTTTTENKLNLSNSLTNDLSKGIYNINIQSNDQVFNTKLIVN